MAAEKEGGTKRVSRVRPLPAQTARHPERGLRPLGGLVAPLTRPAFRRKSPAGAQIMADWPALVGPALAAVTAPRRLSAGTLTLGCAGPVAMELGHLAPQLIARINAALGVVAVQRLRFVQDLVPGTPAATPPLPAPGPLPPRVAAALDGVNGGELREALARLGACVYRNANRT